MSEETSFNSDLIDDLARQRAIIFVGAGVSASAVTKDGKRIKGWPEFLQTVNRKNVTPVQGHVRKLLDERDYLLACEFLQGALEERWGSIVREEFGLAAEPSALHEAIISLNQRIIITTNFDKLLDTCWVSKIGHGSHLPTVISKIDNNIFSILKNHSENFLLKIHGTIDDFESLIFSRSEYIKLAFGNPLYAQFLESILLNYTFIFVGFSMSDPAITSLMEMYTLKYPKSRHHYIFVQDDIPAEMVKINKKLRKLNAITYVKTDRHENLPIKINELSEKIQKRRREIFLPLTRKARA